MYRLCSSLIGSPFTEMNVILEGLLENCWMYKKIKKRKKNVIGRVGGYVVTYKEYEKDDGKNK